MRIHDSMLKVHTHLQKNPYTNQSTRNKAASQNASEFSEHLRRLQANPSAACQNTGAQIANVVWIQAPQMILPRQGQKIKSGAYQALSEI